GQDGGAVDIVLRLLVGLVACAYRSHPAVARQRVDDAFPQVGLAVDPVHGLQVTVLAVGGDVNDVTQVALHGQGGIEAIERIDHEVAVAQPAEAVIPRAAAVRRLRDGGGHGRDDGPGIVVGVEL